MTRRNGIESKVAVASGDRTRHDSSRLASKVDRELNDLTQRIAELLALRDELDDLRRRLDQLA